MDFKIHLTMSLLVMQITPFLFTLDVLQKLLKDIKPEEEFNLITHYTVK